MITGPGKLPVWSRTHTNKIHVGIMRGIYRGSAAPHSLRIPFGRERTNAPRTNRPERFSTFRRSRLALGVDEFAPSCWRRQNYNSCVKSKQAASWPEARVRERSSTIRTGARRWMASVCWRGSVIRWRLQKREKLVTALCGDGSPKTSLLGSFDGENSNPPSQKQAAVRSKSGEMLRIRIGRDR